MFTLAIVLPPSIKQNIEAKFFDHFLKGSGDKNSGLPNAYMFNTGSKEWKTFDKWPSPGATHLKLYLGGDGKLGMGSHRSKQPQHRL
jgi:predicted acyl esterase